MPVNKNALLRFKIIDELLRSNYRYGISFESLWFNTEELLLEHGIKKISERTIRNDLSHIQSIYGISIVCKNGYYKYEDPNASIANSPLNDADAGKLQEALSILEQFSGLPQFKDLEEILIKLDQKVSVKGKPKPKIVDFDVVPSLFGMEHLSTVYTAIIEQLPLHISYKPFLGEVTNFGFSSYLLKEYNNRWFVFGTKDGEKTITNLAIDRIGSISKPTTAFTFNQHFNPEDYFHDIIGVTKLENKDKIEIQLRFTVKRGQYVKSKPLHHSQKIIKENTKSLLLQIDVIPNYELMSVILSFGSDVEVVGPKSYRKEIADAIQRAAQVY